MTMDLVEYDKNFVSVDEKMCNYLEEILKTGNKDSKIVRLDMRDAFINEMKDSPNMKTFYTPYTMLRLFADYLPINLEKILYLDCDLGFLGDISPLYNLDLTGYEYGAAYDVLGRYFIGNYYQNAGVILFNLNECRKSKLFENCRYLCLHVDPVNYDICIPVTEKFPYLKKTLKLRIKYWWLEHFIVRPFAFQQNHKVMKTKVYGRENLKGIKTAICTCNHVVYHFLIFHQSQL